MVSNSPYVGARSLETYLTQAASAGTWDTPGTFTINLSKAKQKFREFGLQSPGMWVVKIVQAAVDAGASEIHFTFQRRKIEAWFEGPKDWSAQDFLQFQMGNHNRQARAKANFHAGLAAATNGEQRSLRWGCGSSCVSFRDGHFWRHTEAKRADIWISVGQRPWRSSPEYRILKSKCQDCSIAVWVNGCEL